MHGLRALGFCPCGMTQEKNEKGPVPTGPFRGSSATRRSLLPFRLLYRPSHGANMSKELGYLKSAGPIRAQ